MIGFEGKVASAADVVAKISAAGGRAIANTDSAIWGGAPAIA